MSGYVGRLRATLGLDSAEFSQKLRGARQETQVFSAGIGQAMRGLTGSVLGTLGIGLSFGAIASGARRAVGELSRLGKQARDTGQDVEDLQGFMRGFERNALVTGDQVVDAFAKFNQSVGLAVEGTGPLVSVFDRLGISVHDANGEVRSQRALLDDVVRAMRRTRSEQERSAIASAAFGDAGRRMAQTLAGGPEALRAMVDEARAAGDIIDRNLIHRAEILDDKFDALTRRVGTFFQALAVGALAGGAETAVDTLTRMFGTLERARLVLGDGVFDALISEMGELQNIDGVTESLRELAFTAEELDRASRTLSSEVAGLAFSFGELGNNDATLAMVALYEELREAGRAFGALEIDAITFEDKLADVATQAIDLIGDLDGVDQVRFETVIGNLGRLVQQIVIARSEAQGLRSDLPGGSSAPVRQSESFWDTDEERFSLNRLAPETSAPPRRAPNNIDFGLPPLASDTGGGGGGSTGPEGYAAAVAQIRERTDALLLEAEALAEVAASGRQYADASEFARIRAELLTAALAEGRQITPELRAEIDQLAETLTNAEVRVEDLSAALDRQAEAGQRGAQALTDIFMAAGQGSDAGRAAVARLIAEIARMQAMRGFQALLSGGGGGWLSSFGSLLIGKNARGTASWRGGWSLVGEEGPEIIKMPATASVTPALESARMLREGAKGGGGAMAITVNVQGANGDQHVIDLVEQGVSLGIKQYDKVLPDRFEQIQKKPRYR